MNYLLHLFIYLCIYGILAMSLNLVVGYCGLMTLAHAAYFAVGAYAYSLLSLTLHWDFVSATLAGMLIAMVLSLTVSLPAWRFKGDLFVMVSLAVQALMFSLLQNLDSPGAPLGSWQNLTNGSFGISGIPKPAFVGFQADTLPKYVLLSTLTLAICSFTV